MGQKGKKNTVQAHQQGIQKLAEAKAAQRDCDGNVWTDLDIAVESGLSEKSVERFCGGQSVRLNTAIAICTALGLEVKEVVDLNEWNPPTPDEPTANEISTGAKSAKRCSTPDSAATSSLPTRNSNLTSITFTFPWC